MQGTALPVRSEQLQGTAPKCDDWRLGSLLLALRSPGLHEKSLRTHSFASCREMEGFRIAQRFPARTQYANVPPTAQRTRKGLE